MKRFMRISVLLLSVLIAGCGSNDQLAQEIDEIHEDAHSEETDHGHVHVAPNGGMLVEIGDHFANIEIVLDSETGVLTLYSLGAHAEKPVRLVEETLSLDVTLGDSDESFTLILDAMENPLSGETIGDTSEFRGQSDALIGVDHFHATLASIQTQGVVFQNIEFAFPHEDH